MEKIKLIYLACPFRHEDVNIQKKRCATAHYVAAQLIAQGEHVFSPLTHNEILIDLVPHIPGEHWMQFDLTILAICDKLLVLKLDGWEISKGVQREIAFAQKNGIPIEEMAPPESVIMGLNDRLP
jgi:hypothetical protein